MDKSSELLATYYAIPGFLNWCNDNDFSLMSLENIRYYYMMFQHYQMCSKKECEKCSGTTIGFEKEEDIATGNFLTDRCKVFEDQFKEDRAKDIWRRFKMPSAYKDLTWDSLKISNEAKTIMQQYSKNYTKDETQGLFIYAKERVGKTACLWLIAQDLLKGLKIYKDLMLESFPMFLANLLKYEFDEHPGNFLFEAAYMCDILLLDDFGREKQTEWSFQKIFAIMEERHQTGRPVIVASEFPPDQMIWTSPFEAKLLSRFNEMMRPVGLMEMETVE